MAVEKRQEVSEWIKKFGAKHFVIALDVNKTESGWLPATHGWLEASKYSLFELVAFYLSIGITDFLCTDISKDGTMTGPSFALYEDLLNEFPDIKVQASGGVSSLKDIKQLNELGVSGIILGKSLLDNAFSVEEAINA